jgi:hypothetical protein
MGTALAGSFLATTANATLVFDYSNENGAAVNFKGGDVGVAGERYFEFTPADNQFKITGTHGGSDTARGLTGNFGATQYRVGAITSFGIASVADILNTGMLTIHDGVLDLTATVDWRNIRSLGQGGLLNARGVVNLSSIAYGGDNVDLLAFKNGTDQNVVLNFIFSEYQPVPLLPHLMAKNAQHTISFAGSMSAVPEASTWVAGSGMLGMLLLFGTGAHGRVRRVFRLGAKNG